MATLAGAVDWHVEVIASIKVLVENADLLTHFPVPIVIDHYGLYDGFHPENSEAGVCWTC